MIESLQFEVAFFIHLIQSIKLFNYDISIIEQ